MKKSEWAPGILEQFHEQSIDLYDYVTCVRADGSYYGNGGTKCIQGSPSSPKKTDKQVKAERAETMKKVEALRDSARKKFANGDNKGGTADVSQAMQLTQNLPKTPSEEKKDKMAREETVRIREKTYDQKSRAAQKPPQVEISNDAKEAIKTYTEPKPNAFKGMNECGRGKNCTEKVEGQIAALDSALQELPANTSGGSYFRGFNASVANFGQLSNLSPGDTLTDGGFGSFSRDPGIAQRFAQGPSAPRRVIIESQSTSIRSAEQFSSRKQEQEGILPRNTPQTVRNVERDGETLYITVD